jgi:hypothetical protein
LGRWSQGQLTDFVVARRLLSPKIQCIINLLLHYVSYVVVELSVNDISFANIVLEVSSRLDCILSARNLNLCSEGGGIGGVIVDDEGETASDYSIILG